MYDSIDGPYTYENSTVLVNKLDVEISSARADEPLPEGNLDFGHYKPRREFPRYPCQPVPRTVLQRRHARWAKSNAAPAAVADASMRGLRSGRLNRRNAFEEDQCSRVTTWDLSI